MPNRAIEFHPKATFEVLEATEFYRLGSAVRASEFVDHLDVVLQTIRAWPLVGRAELRGLRAFTLRGYPYKVVYAPSATHIRVLALAHTSRKPGYWKGR